MPSLSRRSFLGLSGAAAAALLAACTRQTALSPLDWKALPTQAPTPTLRGPEPLDATAALARLLEGNRRFAAGALQHPDQTAGRRQMLSGQQAPIAAVLTCADSCVPPEVLFDQGLGDLLVVRAAGAILSDTLLGSLELAVDRQAVPLIVVLGHQRCAVVKAVVDSLSQSASVPGHMTGLVEALRPAVTQAQPMGGDVVDNAIRAAVTLAQNQLVSQSALLEQKVGNGMLKIVGAYANLDTGALEIVG